MRRSAAGKRRCAVLEASCDGKTARSDAKIDTRDSGRRTVLLWMRKHPDRSDCCSNAESETHDADRSEGLALVTDAGL